MDKIYERTMLFDFYGELLTEHQGISRQGVHDLIRRCDKTLQSYEEKLHLVEKFSETKKVVAQIERLTLMEEVSAEEAGASAGMGTVERLEAIRKLSRGLLEKI